MSLSAGIRLGPYEILSALGAGGMGEVYRARDPRLGRDVAVKVLPPDVSGDPDRLRRFEQEARAAAALNHPHILAIYDVGADDGHSYVVSELLEGQTIRQALKPGPLPIATVIDYGTQIASGLAAAHEKGIVHRDLKPDNFFVTRDGRVKILDFGLAKMMDAVPAAAGSTPLETRAAATEPGTVSGTVGYMSPEQVRGEPVDRRTDLFSFGVVLYEMATGERPYSGSSAMGVADAILHAQPRDFGNASVPASFKSIVRKLLEKDPASRYASAESLHRELKSVGASLAPMPRVRISTPLAVAAVAALVVVAAAGGLLWRKTSRGRWARETATVEIARLIDGEDYVKAAALTLEARAILPSDPTLERLWTQSTGAPSITSDPPGAEVLLRPYRGDPNAWRRFGTTPIKDVRVPKDTYVWRIAKAGFADYNIINRASLSTNFKMFPERAVPAEMVAIRGNAVTLGWPFGLAAQVRVDEYLIDRHEVTNEEFKKFVDAGGYEKREFWTEPFVRDGRAIPWQEAIDSFRDATGRHGPATWEVGSFRKGLENHPVAGVSWYEAAAYARFAGKSIPTIYHWTGASQPDFASVIAPGSNFSNAATVPVGGAGSVSGFGTTDMAGNVKEWCLNESLAGKRLIAGGGFGEPAYMFNMVDALSPWERRPNIGFRCVKLASSPAPAAAAKLEFAPRDVWKDEIVSDEVFAAFKHLYSYDHTELNARVEETKSVGDVAVEKVSFDAAYGGERVGAYLFLPKSISPPFQTVVYAPGAGALLQDRFNPETWIEARMEGDRSFFVKSGRAVVIPVLKGTWERRDAVKTGGPLGNPPALWRDHVIMWSKDLGRTLDYLETRRDIDSSKTAYVGYSFGGAIATVLLATEARLKAAILSSGGQWFERPLPEVDPTNFVTRIKVPVLMLNGRYDSIFPVETAQLPVFRRLGTPDKDKRYIAYDVGHAALPHGEEVRETLDWLDKYLGPVLASARR